jgi:hypothetical protein
MPLKITDEMRAKLRVPLPPEAVSPHPTKTYLSTIKAIYVFERLNDVFGLGSWTLKNTVIEAGEHAIVVNAVLEIPEYGFYGEAYGGNDNADRGDAYKGSTTDALTKIAAQQLEIGMDVYKGLQTGKPGAAVNPTKVNQPVTPPANHPTEHWCKEHNLEWKLTKIGTYGHIIAGTQPVKWCNEPASLKPVTENPESAAAFDSLKSANPGAEVKTEPEKTAPVKKEKPARDPATIKSLADLWGACNTDFKMQPKEVMAELGVNSANEITDTPRDCYLKIAQIKKG